MSASASESRRDALLCVRTQFFNTDKNVEAVKERGKHFLAVGKSQGILIEGEALGTVDLLTKLARFA